MTRHFLNLSDAGGDAIAAMLADAIDRKTARAAWPKGRVACFLTRLGAYRLPRWARKELRNAPSRRPASGIRHPVMDNLCHSLIGMAMSRAGLNRRTALATSTLVIANNLPDVDVAAGTIGMGAGQRTSLLQAGKTIAKDMFQEGFLEELPQGTQEQIFQNLALGKTWNENLGQAAAQGLIIGAGMGGGAGALRAGSNALHASAAAFTPSPRFSSSLTVR